MFAGYGANYPQIKISDGVLDVIWGVNEVDIPDGEAGFITCVGFINGVNTSTWAPGTRLYCMSDGSGMLSDTVNGVVVATVMIQNSVDGVIYVNTIGAGSATSFTRYVTTHNASTDWSLNGDFYEIIIPVLSHSQGATPRIEVYSGTLAAYSVIIPHSISLDIAGNATIRVSSTGVDGRYQGLIVVKLY
jgi:hypothetical protein